MSCAANVDRSQLDPASFDAAQFLATLYAVYRLVSPGPGQMVKLLDLYRIVAHLPTAGRHYSRSAFAWDLYLLDRHHLEAVSGSGLAFRLDRGATAARNRANLLTVISRQGQELDYYGIEFPEPGCPGVAPKSMPAPWWSPLSQALNMEKSSAPGGAYNRLLHIFRTTFRTS